jgi:hypothetical protein
MTIGSETERIAKLSVLTSPGLKPSDTQLIDTAKKRLAADAPAAAQETKRATRHLETKTDVVVAVFLVFYTLVVFLVAMLSLLAIWPRTPSELALNATRTVTLPLPLSLGGPVVLSPETLLATTMVLSGVVGACVYSFHVISRHLGSYQDFDKKWTAWYLLRPFIAAGLAFIFYVLARSGIVTVGADLKNLNLLGLAGVSALVGLFTDHAMARLLELAIVMFGKTPDEPSASNASKGDTKKT